jgi:hypothetical protein
MVARLAGCRRRKSGRGVTTAENAAGLAERGFAVFPVLPNDKKPAIERWPDLACADAAKVREAWPSGHNIGIATGPSGLVVVDLDRGKPLPPPWDAKPGVVDGRDVWAVLRERHDPTWPAWQSTYTVATPSGGLHLYFTTWFDLVGDDGEPVLGQDGIPVRLHCELRNTAALIGPMIDTRADGGYVLGADSVVDGRPYALLEDCEPAELPPWLAKLLTVAQRQERSAPAPATPPKPLRQPDKYVNAAFEREIAAVAGAWEGSRNNQLNKSSYALARFVADGKLDRDLAIAALSRAAETSGLAPTETTRTIRSAFSARGAAA